MFLLGIFFVTVQWLSMSAKTVEVITSLPYSIGVALDVVVNAAAFDLAAQSSMVKYGSHLNINVKYLFNQSHRNCDEFSSQSAQMLSEYYYKHTEMDNCYAVVTTPCNDQTGITSLARAFDWLLFSNALSKNDFTDMKLGLPTAIALTGTYQGYSNAVLEILSYYQWYHATILVEAKAISTFYKELGNLLKESSRLSREPFSLEIYSVDASSNQTIRTALRFAKQRSRVFILLTFGSTAARILKMADQEDLSNGEYVFLNVQPSQADGYGKATQFTYPTMVNDPNLIAFRSLFFIAYRPAGDELKELNLAIAERSKVLYNITYTDGNEPLDLPPVRSSHDIVELFAAIVNESFTNEENGVRCSGRYLAERMSNRTFNLPTGDMYIGPDRARNLDLDIFGFNLLTMSLQPIGTYTWAKSHLTWINTDLISWPTLDHKPPPDIPACGFSGKEGYCATKAIFSIVIAIVSVLVSGLLLSGLLLLSRWYMSRTRALSDNWWKLADEERLVELTSALVHHSKPPSNLLTVNNCAQKLRS